MVTTDRRNAAGWAQHPADDRATAWLWDGPAFMRLLDDMAELADRPWCDCRDPDCEWVREHLPAKEVRDPKEACPGGHPRTPEFGRYKKTRGYDNWVCRRCANEAARARRLTSVDNS